MRTLKIRNLDRIPTPPLLDTSLLIPEIADQIEIVSETIRSLTIVHGHEPRLPDPTLMQRTYNGMMRFITDTGMHYDRLLFTGGLRKVEGHDIHIQPQLAIQCLMELLARPKIQYTIRTLLEEGCIRPDLVENDQVVLDAQRDFMYIWEGNTFIGEWEEIVKKFPDLRHVHYSMESVLFRPERLLRAAKLALQKEGFHLHRKNYIQNGDRILSLFVHEQRDLLEHLIECTSLPNTMSDQERRHQLFYEACSTIIYWLPTWLREPVISILRDGK